jgi:hypothetical protein
MVARFTSISADDKLPILSAGENPKVVSERLGHASITLTLDVYSHVLPTMQQAAEDRLERLMFDSDYVRPGHKSWGARSAGLPAGASPR